MKQLDLILRVRSLTRDFSNSIFREQDIVAYINEGIDRMIEVVPEFETLDYLLTSIDEPILIPKQYQHLLALYSASRCFAQDDRAYQASTFMNEFEVKLFEMLGNIQSGQLIIKDVDGNPITIAPPEEYVKNNYFRNNYTGDIDDGVEGVS